jgi:hypothetical protein
MVIGKATCESRIGKLNFSVNGFSFDGKLYKNEAVIFKAIFIKK